jgi:hypothetical protein
MRPKRKGKDSSKKKEDSSHVGNQTPFIDKRNQKPLATCGPLNGTSISGFRYVSGALATWSRPTAVLRWTWSVGERYLAYCMWRECSPKSCLGAPYSLCQPIELTSVGPM